MRAFFLDDLLARAKSVAVIVMCGAVTWAVVRIGSTAPPAFTSVGGASVALNTSLTHTDEQLNGKDGKGGLLPGVTAVLANANSGVTEVRGYAKTAAWKINGNGKGYDGLITQLYKDTHDVHRLLAEASIEQKGYYKTMSQDTHDFLVAVTTDAKDIDPLIRSLTDRANDIAKLINDPAITDALHNLDLTSADVEKSTAQLTAIMIDLRGKIDDATHPSKKQRAYSNLLGVIKLLYYLEQVIPH